MNCYLIFLEYQIKFALDKGQPSGSREGGGGEIKAQRNTGTRPRKAKTRLWTLSQSIWRSWLRRWRLLKMVPWKTDGEAPEDGAMKNWQGGSLRRCHEKLTGRLLKTLTCKTDMVLVDRVVAIINCAAGMSWLQYINSLVCWENCCLWLMSVCSVNFGYTLYIYTCLF